MYNIYIYTHIFFDIRYFHHIFQILLLRYRCLESACPGGSPGTCGGGRIGPTCGRCPPNEFFSEVPCNAAALNRSKHLVLNAQHWTTVTTVLSSFVTFVTC